MKRQADVATIAATGWFLHGFSGLPAPSFFGGFACGALAKEIPTDDTTARRNAQARRVFNATRKNKARKAMAGVERHPATHLTKYNPARFAMEMAVYLALTKYEESLRLPSCLVPKPDGKGGIEPEAVVPESWLKPHPILQS